MKPIVGIEALTISHLSLITPAARRAVTTIVTALGRRAGTVRTLKDFDREGILVSARVAPSQLIADIDLITRLEVHRNLGWVEFQRLPAAPALEIMFVRLPSITPRDQFLGACDRYAWTDLNPRIDLEIRSMGFYLDSASVRLHRIARDNARVVDAFRTLQKWNPDWSKLPPQAFAVDPQGIRDGMSTVAIELGFRDLETAVSSEKEGEPNPEKTLFRTAYDRLMRATDERLASYELSLTGSLSGLPFSFPLKPIVLLVPILLPFYVAATIQLFNSIRRHRAAMTDIEAALNPELQGTVISLSAGGRDPWTLQLSLIQLAVVVLGGWTTVVAFQMIGLTRGLGGNLPLLGYSILLLGSWAVVVWDLGGLRRR